MAVSNQATADVARTPSGINEHGSANHRHFVRVIDRLDSHELGVLCSFSDDTLQVSIGDPQMFETLAEICAEHDYEVVVGGVHSTGRVNVLCRRIGSDATLW